MMSGTTAVGADRKAAADDLPETCEIRTDVVQRLRASGRRTKPEITSSKISTMR
jgi:hypothetical protein